MKAVIPSSRGVHLHGGAKDRGAEVEGAKFTASCQGRCE